MRLSSCHSRSCSGGFTLVELLLAVTLLAGLMAAAVFGFSSLHRSAQLNEGVERVETAMRFARAHAANTGRKVQVVVTAAETQGSSTSATSDSSSAPTSSGESTPSLSILWEADPAGAPGVFEPIPSLSAEVSDVSELVEIRSVGRESKESESMTSSTSVETVEPVSAPLGNNGLANAAGGETESESGQEPSVRSTRAINPGETTITFYPDGSCDGATIVLASRDSDDARQVAVHLESITGTTRRHWKASPNDAGAADGSDSPPSPRASSTVSASSPAGSQGSPRVESPRSIPQTSTRTTASTAAPQGQR